MTNQPKKTAVFWLAFLAICFVEVGAHRLISTHRDSVLWRVYSYRDLRNGREIRGLFDFGIPSIVMGVWLGIRSRGSTAITFFVRVLVVAGTIVCLLPLYALWSGPESLWWWPGTGAGVAAELWSSAWRTFLFCLAAAIGGLAMREEIQERETRAAGRIAK